MVEQAATGTLFLVATPIGNLQDITLRALDTLKSVHLIAAEDTRKTRILLTHFEIKKRLLSYHNFNERTRTPELLRALQQGKDVALVTESGTPTISDPGFFLVRAALAQEMAVVPIPGPSAATAALSASGLPAEHFLFLGFPPRKKQKRLTLFQQLASLPWTLILYESPFRVLSTLKELTETFGGDRNAAIARELTKHHEEFLRGTLAELLDQLSQRPAIKGEFTLLLAGKKD